MRIFPLTLRCRSAIPHLARLLLCATHAAAQTLWARRLRRLLSNGKGKAGKPAHNHSPTEARDERFRAVGKKKGIASSRKTPLKRGRYTPPPTQQEPHDSAANRRQQEAKPAVLVGVFFNHDSAFLLPTAHHFGGNIRPPLGDERGKDEKLASAASAKLGSAMPLGKAELSLGGKTKRGI